jgi:glutathione S-transferase
MILWGRKNSMNVQKVTWALEELGIDCVRHDVAGSFGRTDTPEYMAMNPNKVVPTLQDGALTLWESNAVVRYLARTYDNGTLLPADKAQAALADQWMEWMTSTLVPSFYKIFLNKIRLPDGNAALLAEGIAGCAQQYALLDQHLASNRYVAGTDFSMGDIPIGATLYRYFNMDIERPSLPNLEAFYARLCQREAYAEHVMIPFGTNAAEWLQLEQAGAAD